MEYDSVSTTLSAVSRKLLLALAFVVSLVAVLVSAEAIKEALDGLAGGGGSWFFELRIVRGLRVTAILFGPTVLLVPYLRGLLEVPLEHDEVQPGARRGVELLLVAALIVTGLARLEGDSPISRDGSSYLTDSLEIADAGGLATLPGRLFRGEYLEDNRHPFYAGVLSTVAERSDRFTDRAKLFSLGGAAFALLFLMGCARRSWGPHGALVAGALFVTNGVVLETSTIVGCESWLMVFLVLWFGRATRTPSLRNDLSTGAFAGLAYLVKGTGTLVLLTTCLQLFWTRGRKALAPCAAVLGTFCVVAAPLLWRNALVHSNPVYNVNSSQALWLDNWSDFENSDVMERAGPVEYLRTHSPLEIGKRIGVGVFKECIHVLQVFSPASPWAGLGLPVLLAVALCVRRDDAPARKQLLLILFGLFFLAFAWYAQVVQGWRFVGSLVPLLLLPAAALGPRLAQRIGARRLELGTAALAALLILAGLLDGAASFRPNRFTPSVNGAAVQAFLRERIGSRYDIHYLLGPSRSLTCDWDLGVRGGRHRFPRTEAEYAELLSSNWGARIRFAILAEPQPGETPRVGDAWVRAGDAGLEPADVPAGWTLVRSIPPARPEVLIFERAPR